jgi:hypothetical protein
MRKRLFGLTELHQRIGEIVVGAGEVRHQRRGTPIVRDRFGAAAQFP